MQPRTDLEIGSREVIREAVARGLGWGAVSEAEFIADPASCPCASRASRPAPLAYVYCMAERADSELIRSFLSAI